MVVGIQMKSEQAARERVGGQDRDRSRGWDCWSSLLVGGIFFFVGGNEIPGGGSAKTIKNDWKKCDLMRSYKVLIWG